MAPMPVLPEFNQDRVAKPQTSRSNRSIFFYITAFVGISWLAYALLSKPSPAASEITMTTPEGYGQNAKPEFKDVIQIMDLPSQYVPETGKNRGLGRLVVVGDVHGMKDSLVELLKKVGFKEKHDHLILAGDIISKGPDSVGVVDLAMKLGATVVRGNHEDRILLAHADMVAKHMDIDEPGPSEPEDKKIDEMEELSFSHGDYKDRKLVKELGEKRIKWLKQSPVILRVGPLGKMGEVVVVHAGLAPGVALEKQDPTLVMTMRTIKDGVPSEERDGKGWMKVLFLSSGRVNTLLTTHCRRGTITKRNSPRRIARQSSMDTIRNAVSRWRNTALVLTRDV